MTNVQQASLIQTLDKEQFSKVGTKIAGLPSSDDFREQVEDDLWQTLIGSVISDDGTIDYQKLSQESRSVIGYVADDGNQSVPWWLNSFKWVASSRGEDLALERESEYNDELSKFENFDPEATTIHKPKFQEQGISNILNAFEKLSETLDDKIGIESRSTTLAVPSNIFEITENSITTSEAFKNWFNSLLEYCPPVNDELTALLIVNTGVRKDALDGVVTEELLDRIEQLGFNDDKIFERDYYQPLVNILELSNVFDLFVPGADRFDALGGLEGILYETWAQHYSGDQEAVSRWITQASDWNPDLLEEGEEPKFGGLAFSVPLYLTYDKPCYTSLHINTSGNRAYPNGPTRDKLRDIREIMETNGYL